VSLGRGPVNEPALLRLLESFRPRKVRRIWLSAEAASSFLATSTAKRHYVRGLPGEPGLLFPGHTTIIDVAYFLGRQAVLELSP
jgi:hypothetical protein